MTTTPRSFHCFVSLSSRYSRARSLNTLSSSSSPVFNSTTWGRDTTGSNSAFGSYTSACPLDVSWAPLGLVRDSNNVPVPIWNPVALSVFFTNASGDAPLAAMLAKVMADAEFPKVIPPLVSEVGLSAVPADPNIGAGVALLKVENALAPELSLLYTDDVLVISLLLTVLPNVGATLVPPNTDEALVVLVVLTVPPNVGATVVPPNTDEALVVLVVLTVPPNVGAAMVPPKADDVLPVVLPPKIGASDVAVLTVRPSVGAAAITPNIDGAPELAVVLTVLPSVGAAAITPNIDGAPELAVVLTVRPNIDETVTPPNIDEAPELAVVLTVLPSVGEAWNDMDDDVTVEDGGAPSLPSFALSNTDLNSCASFAALNRMANCSCLFEPPVKSSACHTQAQPLAPAIGFNSSSGATWWLRQILSTCSRRIRMRERRVVR